MAQARFVLTGDVDWASEHCIQSYVDHASSHGIVPTLFVTHRSAAIEQAAAAGKAHLGIHPNFLPGSSHGATTEQILDHVMDLVPEPVASRSHCFADDSHVAQSLARRGIAVDSNICCHLQEGLPVLNHWNGVKRLPVFFEDDVHWEQRGTWSFADYRAAFASPGLKILNFHPFLWALNVPDAGFYAAHRSHIPTLTKAQAETLRHRGQGSATFLDEIIVWVRENGGEFVSLPAAVRDPVSERTTMLLSKLLAGLPAEVVRDVEVAGFGLLNMSGEGRLRYYSDPRFTFQLTALSGEQAILTTPGLKAAIPAGFGLALCDNPKETFLKAYRRHGAEIEAAAPFATEIDASARIHPRAVIADHGVRIGANVSIGANTVIHEGVTIEQDAVVGANTVLGGEGFEVGMVDGLQMVVPHYGTVLVRRGAVIHTNTSIDRGVYGGCTEIGEGTVVDNLVHIAHNVRIGRNCQIIACSVVGGSTVIEDEARIGPNATVSNGLRIGKGARVTLGSVVAGNVEDGGHVTGNFAVPHLQFLRKSGEDHANFANR